MAWRLYPIAGC